MEARINMTDNWTTLYEYLDRYADVKKHDKGKEFETGYMQACKDIFEKLFDSKLVIESNIKRIIIMEEKQNDSTKLESTTKSEAGNTADRPTKK